MSEAVTDWHAVKYTAQQLKDAEMEQLADRNIGDLASNAVGSGARFNAGKPPLDLIPLEVVSRVQDNLQMRGLSPLCDPLKALQALGRFQMDRSASNERLYEVIRWVGADWDDCARVFDFGRTKYAPWNWAKGMPWSTPIGSAARHLLAMARGEQTDPESGLTHAGHVMRNVVMLLWYDMHFGEGDDRRVEPERQAA